MAISLFNVSEQCSKRPLIGVISMVGFRNVLGHAMVLLKSHEMYGDGCFGVTNYDAEQIHATINVLMQFTESELSSDQLPTGARLGEIERNLGMPKAEFQLHLTMIQDFLGFLQQAESLNDDDASES